MNSNLSALALMLAVKYRVEYIGGSLVISNREMIEWLGVSRNTFDEIRKQAIEAGLVTYECRSDKGTKKGVYNLGTKCPEFVHMLKIQAPLIYIYTTKKDIKHIKGTQKLGICPKSVHLVEEKADPIKEEFDAIWPELRMNDRSSKSQSLKAWRLCRTKFTADQIKAAWAKKVSTYSSKDWVCGFQVFCKPDDVRDFQPKPKDTSPMAKFNVKEGEWDL